MPVTLILERNTNYVAELRRKPFEIVLDGSPAGAIERNATVELPVAPGPHTLQVRSGRYSSPTRSFDAVEGANPRFRCNGAVLWPQYVASLLVRTIGLKLKAK